MVDDLYQEGRDLLEEEHKEDDWELYKMVKITQYFCISNMFKKNVLLGQKLLQRLQQHRGEEQVRQRPGQGNAGVTWRMASAWSH